MPIVSEFLKAACGAACLTVLFAGGVASAADDEATWEDVRSMIYGDRAVQDDNTRVSLGAPVRAEDAALVPVDLHVAMPEAESGSVRVVTLVVDENPSPLVAKLMLADGTRHFDLSTRVRVNSYSFVRAIAEMSDGTLHMTKAFVKAAGGCSAPASKDPAEAKADVGQMRFRVFSGTGRDEAQLQIRHPNNSGMQMNQITRLYDPAWFIQSLTVKQGPRVLFSMEGGISLSEDPTFRFSYKGDGQPVTVEAKDSNGTVFRHEFPGDGA